MADVLTIDDLIADKKHSTFFAEVVTGKTGGLSSGADIPTATNEVTGQVQKTIPAITQTAESDHAAQMQSFENDFVSRLAGMAFTRVGTFTTGATLTDMRQTLLWELSQGGDGREYGWTGSFLPAGKVVAAGSSPMPVSAGNWVDRTEDRLRSDLNVVVKVFESVADMAADATLIIGQKCRTLGYYAVGDVGGNDYEIVAADTGTDDGGAFIDISNGLQAKGLFVDGIVNACQFGAKGDYGEVTHTDNSVMLSNAARLMLPVELPGGRYFCGSEFNVPSVLYSRDVAEIFLGGLYPKIVSDTDIQGITIRSSSVTRFANNPNAGKSLRLDSCELINFKVTAILATTGINDLRVRNSKISTSDTNTNPIELDCDSYHIDGNTITGGCEGIKSLNASSGGVITHNLISGCSRDAIDLYTGGKRVLISGNTLRNCQGGIDYKVRTDANTNTDNPCESIISNNHIYDNSVQGITLSAPNTTVIGNVITNNGGRGIDMGQAPYAYNNVVIGNIVKNNGLQGIYLNQPNANVANNILYDNDTTETSRINLTVGTSSAGGTILGNTFGYSTDQSANDCRGIYYTGTGGIVESNNFNNMTPIREITGTIENAKIVRNNGSYAMRTGGTALRPTSPAQFEQFYNTDTAKVETYVGTSWG